jgi:L-fuculose-phosphate aldolase
MGSRRSYLTKQIVHICQKLDSKGFVANHDGNISVRFEHGLLATPTSESKAEINEDMIISLDMEGKKIEGIGKPFSEIKLHLSAYKARPETVAVVHAHPPFCTSQSTEALPEMP